MKASIRSSDSIRPKRNALQFAVLAAILRAGTITDGELERLPEFAKYAPSTIRKRRSELYQLGDVVKRGTDGRMTLWSVA